MKINYAISGDFIKGRKEIEVLNKEKGTIAVSETGDVIVLDNQGNYAKSENLKAEYNYPMTKETFVSVMNGMKKTREKIQKIEDVLSETCEDSVYCPPSDTNILLDLLSDLFIDKNDWIGYFIYELDFGKRWKKGMITEEDGTDVKMETPFDLYDVLIKDQKYYMRH